MFYERFTVNIVFIISSALDALPEQMVSPKKFVFLLLLIPSKSGI